MDYATKVIATAVLSALTITLSLTFAGCTNAQNPSPSVEDAPRRPVPPGVDLPGKDSGAQREMARSVGLLGEAAWYAPYVESTTPEEAAETVLDAAPMDGLIPRGSQDEVGVVAADLRLLHVVPVVRVADVENPDELEYQDLAPTGEFVAVFSSTRGNLYGLGMRPNQKRSQWECFDKGSVIGNGGAVWQDLHSPKGQDMMFVPTEDEVSIRVWYAPSDARSNPRVLLASYPFTREWVGIGGEYLRHDIAYPLPFVLKPTN